MCEATGCWQRGSDCSVRGVIPRDSALLMQNSRVTASSDDEARKRREYWLPLEVMGTSITGEVVCWEQTAASTERRARALYNMVGSREWWDGEVCWDILIGMVTNTEGEIALVMQQNVTSSCHLAANKHTHFACFLPL